MSIFFLGITDYKKHPNKINNIDNENIFKMSNLEIKGNFWGLRKYKKKKKYLSTGIFGSNIILQEIDTLNKNIYKQVEVGKDYLLLGDINNYYLFKIKGKFINNNHNLFDENIFDYCFLLEKTSYKINHQELKDFLEREDYKYYGRRCSNFTRKNNQTAKDLMCYIDTTLNNILGMD